MKYLITIPMLLIAFGTVRAQSSDSLEYALSFYPIQIGNQWDYYDDGNGILPPLKTYIKIQVTGDTLIQGQTYQIMHQRRWHERFWVDPDIWVFTYELYTYERLDTATANVYAWAAHFDSPREVLIDSLMADSLLADEPVGIPSYRMRYRINGNYDVMVNDPLLTELVRIENFELFGTERQVRLYFEDGIFPQGYELADGLGMVGLGGGEVFSRLVYARINGEEFGERIFTNMDKPGERPLAVRLHPNYPNPFNPSTTLSYDLDQPGPVKLEVYDLTGRQVALLTDGHAPAGQHTAVFNAAGLASGFYVARLTTQGAVQHRKMLLVR